MAIHINEKYQVAGELAVYDITFNFDYFADEFNRSVLAGDSLGFGFISYDDYILKLKPPICGVFIDGVTIHKTAPYWSDDYRKQILARYGEDKAGLCTVHCRSGAQRAL